MASVQQPIYPKVEEAEPSAPPPPYSSQSKAYPAQSQPFPTQPQPWNYPPETYGKPADPAVGYWHPQQPGYTGLPQSEAGFAGHPPGQPGVVIVPQKGQQVVIVRERESFVKQIVLSCVVTWCCCWPLGLVAFILAMIANSNANATDENSVKKAHNLGVHSCRTSIAGIIIGVILIVTYICLQVFVKSKYEDGEP